MLNNSPLCVFVTCFFHDVDLLAFRPLEDYLPSAVRDFIRVHATNGVPPAIWIINIIVAIVRQPLYGCVYNIHIAFSGYRGRFLSSQLPDSAMKHVCKSCRQVCGTDWLTDWHTDQLNNQPSESRTHNTNAPHWTLVTERSGGVVTAANSHSGKTLIITSSRRPRNMTKVLRGFS